MCVCAHNSFKRVHRSVRPCTVRLTQRIPRICAFMSDCLFVFLSERLSTQKRVTANGELALPRCNDKAACVLLRNSNAAVPPPRPSPPSAPPRSPDSARKSLTSEELPAAHPFLYLSLSIPLLCEAPNHLEGWIYWD